MHKKVRASLSMLTLSFLVFCITSCSSFGISIKQTLGIPITAYCMDYGVNSVSAAYDGRHYVYSYCDDKRSIIGIGDIMTNTTRIVLESDDGTLYQRPVTAMDGKEIIFIARKTMESSALYSINVDGSGLNQLPMPPYPTDKLPTHEDVEIKNLLDIALSPDGEKLYFANAGTYTYYSPMA